MVRLDETRVLDRATGEVFVEQVFGGTMLALAYQNPLGRGIGARPALQRWISRLVGHYQSTARSGRGIRPFVARYGVKLADYVEPPGGFRSFNDFFVRKLAPGARPFPSDSLALGAAAEGRLSVFALPSVESALTIKGAPLSLTELVGSAELARGCVGGHAFVFRLCPVDYHRFHFPDGGVPGEARRIDGLLHSVHPVAQRVVPGLFARNERQVVTLASDAFGRLVLVDVGAMCVGTIVQTYAAGRRVARGEERGYFAFGGSTTIVVTEPDRVVPDADVLESTARGIEVLVRVGEAVARTASPSRPARREGP